MKITSYRGRPTWTLFSIVKADNSHYEHESKWKRRIMISAGGYVLMFWFKGRWKECANR